MHRGDGQHVVGRGRARSELAVHGGQRLGHRAHPGARQRIVSDAPHQAVHDVAAADHGADAVHVGIADEQRALLVDEIHLVLAHVRADGDARLRVHVDDQADLGRSPAIWPLAIQTIPPVFAVHCRTSR